MKKLLITVALTAAVCVSTYAQGTVDFRNRITGTLDVPVFAADTTTRLGDAGYVAQLYFSATQGGSYSAVTAAPSPFRTGTGAGYWNAGADSTRILTGIAGGTTAWLQVRVWELARGATYDAAVAAGSLYGISTPFSVTAGGGGVPPSSPAFMTGLASFALVPEPSTIALGVLGLAGLLFIRRRK
jgi:hypothetical protein